MKPKIYRCAIFNGVDVREYVFKDDYDKLAKRFKRLRTCMRKLASAGIPRAKRALSLDDREEQAHQTVGGKDE